jgi:methyl-accepting chemotaxis protein
VIQACDGVGIKACRRSGLERITGISGAIAAAVEEQDATTQGIARSALQTAAHTGDVSGRLGRLSDAVRHTDKALGAAAAGQVLGAAAALSEQSAHLRRQIDDFLRQGRAA